MLTDKDMEFIRETANKIAGEFCEKWNVDALAGIELSEKIADMTVACISAKSWPRPGWKRSGGTNGEK